MSGRGRFAAVRAWRAQAMSGSIRVHAAPNGRDAARFGFAVPGMASAVARNRLRRRLRAATAPLVSASAGFDLILTAGPTAERLPFAELSSQVATAATEAVARARRRTPPPSEGRSGRLPAQNEAVRTATGALALGSSGT